MKKNKHAPLASATRAIHAGEPPRHGVDAPVSAGIVRSSTFTFSSSEEMKLWAEGKSKAYIYTRYANPTLAIAERKIASLEGAEAAIVTSSGMAAISHSLLSVLRHGDELTFHRAALWRNVSADARRLAPHGYHRASRGNLPGKN